MYFTLLLSVQKECYSESSGINAFSVVFQGKLLAVCSAATKSSVILCLENLIGLVSDFWKHVSFIILFLVEHG